jgi:uncharacterized protein
MFHWDKANLGHIAEHGVSPDEAQQVINNDPFDIEFQYRNNEERTVPLGETIAGRIIVVVSTWRGDLVRVITAFPAPQALRTLYLAQRGESHGEGVQDP